MNKKNAAIIEDDDFLNESRMIQKKFSIKKCRNTFPSGVRNIVDHLNRLVKVRANAGRYIFRT